ncbi:hypothetical protein D9M68_930820 [compost metagenome]
MNAFAVQTELEKSRLIEQALQVDVRVLADQFDMDGIEGAEGFGAVESQHLEVITNGRD